MYATGTFIFVDNQVNFIKQQAGKPITTAIKQTTPNNQITVSNYTTKIDYPYTQVRDKFPSTNKPKYKIDSWQIAGRKIYKS